MNNWSPRTVRGLIFFGIGMCAFKLQPVMTAALVSSLFWSGLSQAGLSLVGMVSLAVGVYFLATRYKK
ncbi:hypothetical protein [Janthinobacterium sp. LM6]|uniref:hypothetical protein n=1 Tax=Janthinobacterium sp. LM6 TaxID=1938606 RepID=UPI0012374CEA|nr:hypothetical protein [Janthinobacterium sp. LM6]